MPAFHFFSHIAASGRLVLGAIGRTAAAPVRIGAMDGHQEQNPQSPGDSDLPAVAEPYGYLALKAQLDALGRQIAAMERMVALIVGADDFGHSDQPGMSSAVAE